MILNLLRFESTFLPFQNHSNEKCGAIEEVEEDEEEEAEDG